MKIKILFYKLLHRNLIYMVGESPPRIILIKINLCINKMTKNKLSPTPIKINLISN
jgi:hypothetical protein